MKSQLFSIGFLIQLGTILVIFSKSLYICLHSRYYRFEQLFMKSITTTIIFILLFHTIATAQSSRLEYANRAFERHYYDTAIELYAKILTKKKDKKALINLATCYRKIGDWNNAEYRYGQLVNAYRKPKAEFVFYYAMALQINNKAEEAEEWFEKYVELNPEDPRGMMFKEDCHIDQLEALLEDKVDDYTIKGLPINTEEDEFAAKLTPDGNLIFSRGNTGMMYGWYVPVFEPYDLELFQVKLTPAITAATEEPAELNFGKKLRSTKVTAQNTRHSCVSYTADEQQVYYMQYDRKECGKNIPNLIPYKVYSAQKQRKTWGYTLPFDYNADEYTVTHPMLSGDGMRIYFASDMPGGKGGMDIFYCEFDEGSWSEPINMGDSVNTAGDEVFPYEHYETGKFYFASNGWGGLGGLDFFVTTAIKKKVWKTPQNLGAPFNSNRNEFSIFINNEESLSFIASDRKGQGGKGGVDIYEIRKVVD